MELHFRSFISQRRFKTTSVSVMNRSATEFLNCCKASVLNFRLSVGNTAATSRSFFSSSSSSGLRIDHSIPFKGKRSLHGNTYELDRLAFHLRTRIIFVMECHQVSSQPESNVRPPFCPLECSFAAQSLLDKRFRSNQLVESFHNPLLPPDMQDEYN